MLPQGGADLALYLYLLPSLVHKELSKYLKWKENGIERVREETGWLQKPLTFSRDGAPLQRPPQGRNWPCVMTCGAAVLVDGMAVKPCQGIFKPMSSCNPQCSWAQLGSEEEVDFVGSLANI